MGEHHVGIGILDRHLGHTTNNDVHAVLILHGAQVFNLDATVILGSDIGNSRSVACHTTGVEGTQCELSTRLTDRLCGNHTDSLAALHHAVRCQVATVALGADAVLGLASED